MERYTGKVLQEEKQANIINAWINIAFAIITAILVFVWQKALPKGDSYSMVRFWCFIAIAIDVVSMISSIKALIKAKALVVEEGYSEEQFNRTCLGSKASKALIALAFLFVLLFMLLSENTDEITVYIILTVVPMILSIVVSFVAMKLAHNRLLKEKEIFDMKQEEEEEQKRIQKEKNAEKINNILSDD